MGTNHELIAEFEAIYTEWFERVGGEPGDFFNRVLSDDWVHIDLNGVVRYKSDYGPHIAPLTKEEAPAGLKDLRARRYGDIAILDGAYTIPGLDNPDLNVRFTAVWIKTSGTWQALAHHTSEVRSE